MLNIKIKEMINKIVRSIGITVFIIVSIGTVVLCYYASQVSLTPKDCCIPTNGWHMDTMGDTTKVTLHYYDEITIEP